MFFATKTVMYLDNDAIVLNSLSEQEAKAALAFLQGKEPSLSLALSLQEAFPSLDQEDLRRIYNGWYK